MPQPQEKETHWHTYGGQYTSATWASAAQDKLLLSLQGDTAATLLLVTTVNSRARVPLPTGLYLGTAVPCCAPTKGWIYLEGTALLCASIYPSQSLHWSTSLFTSQSESSPFPTAKAGPPRPQQPAGHCISEIEADSFALICLAHAQYLLHLYSHNFVYRIR